VAGYALNLRSILTYVFVAGQCRRSLPLHRGVFYLALFVGEGSQESGVEWPFDMSL
jgi:hypothetical protein